MPLGQCEQDYAKIGKLWCMYTLLMDLSCSEDLNHFVRIRATPLGTCSFILTQRNYKFLILVNANQQLFY